MKKILLLLAAAAVCLGLSGCTVFEADTEALMHPPVFTEEQEKLNTALTEVIGESYTLKYPQNGEMNSAFVFEDLDKDGTEEAVAFYSILDESTRINILKNEGERWTSVYEAAGFYGDIEKIDFVDIDNGGKVVLVKWETEAAVYRYENERLITLHRASCEGANIADMNTDGFAEIILFAGNLSGRSVLTVLFSNGEDFVVSENINTHAEYANIYSAVSGEIHPGAGAYFIDSQIYEGVYLTEILVLENGEISRDFIADYVEYEDGDEEENETSSGTIVIVGGGYGKRGIFLRNTPVPCMDTNNDGIMEMPVEVREDYAQEKSDVIYFLQYMQYNGETSVPVWNGIANAAGGYLFAVPENWNNKVSVSISSSGEELIFTETSTGKEILSIYSVLKSDYQDKYEEYVLGSENGARNFYIKSSVDEESEFYIDPQNYKNSFIFMQ